MTDLIKLAVDSMSDNESEGPRVILGAESLERFAHAIIAAHTAKMMKGMEPVHHEMIDGQCAGYYAADQLAAAITARDQRIEELENECKAWALTVDNLEAKQCLNAPQIVT